MYAKHKDPRFWLGRNVFFCLFLFILAHLSREIYLVWCRIRSIGAERKDVLHFFAVARDARDSDVKNEMNFLLNNVLTNRLDCVI